MSKMQLRMEAESGSPQKLPTLQDAARCSPEGVVYKLCKRGHVRNPFNVDSHGRCKRCRELPELKLKEKVYGKVYNQRPERKAKNNSRSQLTVVKQYRKRYSQTETNKNYRKHYVENLTDGYVIQGLLRLPRMQVPKELIELKRITIQIQRELRK